MNLLNRKIIKLTFNANDRINIYDNFRQFLLDGIEIKQIYEKLIYIYTRRGKEPNDAIGLVLQECSSLLQGGASLANSLAEWIPEQERSVIEACTLAGSPQEGFLKAEKIASNTSRIKKSMLVTTFIFWFMNFILLAILTIVCSMIIPIIIETIPLERWSLSQKTVYYIYMFISNYWFIAIAILILILYLIYNSLPRWTGPIRFKIDKFPPYSFYRQMQGATFITNVAAMLSSGISLEDSLIKIRDGSNSAWLKERIDAAISGLNNGEGNLGDALDVSGYEFPSESAIIKMQSLFQTSNGEKSLEDFSDRSIESTISNITTTGNVIQMLSMFANVIGIVALFVIMYDLIAQMFTL